MIFFSKIYYISVVDKIFHISDTGVCRTGGFLSKTMHYGKIQKQERMSLISHRKIILLFSHKHNIVIWYDRENFVGVYDYGYYNDTRGVEFEFECQHFNEPIVFWLLAAAIIHLNVWLSIVNHLKSPKLPDMFVLCLWIIIYYIYYMYIKFKNYMASTLIIIIWKGQWTTETCIYCKIFQILYRA